MAKQPFGAAKSDLWTAVVLGVLVIVGTLVTAVRRVIEIAPNQDVPVDVTVTPQQRPISIDGVGEAVPVELDSGTVIVSDLPVWSHLAALAAVVVPALAVIAVALCVAWLCRNLASGVFFSGTNTRLVTATSLVILAGWLLTTVATTVAANGAYRRLSDGSGEFEVTMDLSFFYLFVAMVVGCLAGAFRAGERLQRDTAGLV